MSIPTTIESLSTTAASNGPAGSEQRTLADDGLRQGFAFIKQLKSLATLASGNTVTPPSTANVFSVTGTTTINTIASTNSWDGRDIWFVFAGALTLTHSSNLDLPGAANITTVVGDTACFIQTASGAWICAAYQRGDGSIVGSTGVNLTLTGNLSVQGNTTIGNASGDTLTVAPNAVTWSNNPTHSGNHTFGGTLIAVGNAALNSNVTLGDASGDTLTVHPNAVTWVNNPTHSGNHVISGTLGVTAYASGFAPKFNVGVAGDSTASLKDTTNSIETLWVTSSSGGGTVATGSFTNHDYVFRTNNAEKLRITTDGRIYGTALHNNAGAVTGTTNQYVASNDQFTPTFTAGTNVASGTASASGYVRTGNVVMMGGSGTVDPTSAATSSEFFLSLPIATNLVGNDCWGTVVIDAGATTLKVAGSIAADTAGDRASFTFVTSADVASRGFAYTLFYVVK